MSFRTPAEYGHIIKFRCILNRSVHKNRMEENLNIKSKTCVFKYIKTHIAIIFSIVIILLLNQHL